MVPEFSFVLGGPEDPEAEIERTFTFIRQVKALHPQCEVILYFYSPTPQRDRAWADRDVALLPSLATSMFAAFARSVAVAWRGSTAPRGRSCRRP